MIERKLSSEVSRDELASAFDGKGICLSPAIPAQARSPLILSRPHNQVHFSQISMTCEATVLSISDENMGGAKASLIK